MLVVNVHCHAQCKFEVPLRFCRSAWVLVVHVYCHAQCQCDPCLSTGVLWCLWSVCIVTLSVSVTPVCLQECCGACGQCVLSRSVSV